jgi:hypothetical protein
MALYHKEEILSWILGETVVAETDLAVWNSPDLAVW